MRRLHALAWHTANRVSVPRRTARLSPSAAVRAAAALLTLVSALLAPAVWLGSRLWIGWIDLQVTSADLVRALSRQVRLACVVG